jgi:hypothetical protein
VTSAVQGWSLGTYTNYGFTVRPNVTSGSTNVLYTFATREYTTNTAYRPILRVNYTPMSWDCSYAGSGTCIVCAAPAVPTNNAAADLSLCDDTGVQIAWAQDVSDWGDGGVGARTYEVLRNGSTIASGIAYGTTSYTDTTGVNGTSSTYAVRYSNGCGLAATTTGASASDDVTVCTALDSCHDVGTCDPGTGICSNPAKPNGTSCDDGNLCTQTDSCQSGVCTGSNPVVCTALDPCHDVGVCDAGTGLCSNLAKADGTSCDDGSPYTTGDRCLAGTCLGEPVEAAPGDTPSDALGWSGTGVATWPPLPGATGYRLYRGGPADLLHVLDSGADSC